MSSIRENSVTPKTSDSMSLVENLNFYLGIDIGLTNIKITIVDGDKRIVHTTKEEHKANISNLSREKHEQDPLMILDKVEKMMTNIAIKYKLERVKAISISGQMHGIVRWSAEELQKAWNCLNPNLKERGEAQMSTLITGRDRRGFTANYAASMPQPMALNALLEGNGCVTLCWLQKYGQSCKFKYDSCGSMGDLLVMRLTNQNKAKMTDCMAATWGYYVPPKNNRIKPSWEINKLKVCDVPGSMLPFVVCGGNKSGCLASIWHAIPKGVPVLAAIPDIHASFFAFMAEYPKSAILNIGTSVQFVMKMRAGFEPPSNPRPCGVKYYPFVGENYLAVASSINGNNVIESFATKLKDIAQNMANRVVDEKDIRNKIEEIMKSEDASDERSLDVIPLLQPETHSRTINASISYIKSDNLTVRNLMLGSVQGVVNNIFNMIPVEDLITHNVNKIVLVGFATKSYYMSAINNACDSKLPLVIGSSKIDAAFGAALLALQNAAKP